MNRRILAYSFIAVLLLSSCNKNQTLRSDISDFIASFSIRKSIDTYLEAGYIRTDESIEDKGTILATETFNFNVKDPDNMTYDFHYVEKLNDVITNEKTEQILKVGESYFYYLNDDDPLQISEESVKNDYIKKFFYKSSIDESYYKGMYAGDMLISVIYDIQDCVTIDIENKLLVYSKPRDLKDSDLDFEQILKVNELGMTVSDDTVIYGPNSTQTTHIEVYNNI